MIATRGMGAGFGATLTTAGMGAGYGSAPPPAVVTLSGGGWVQTWTINAQWRRRQDEEWVILHG